jgi:NADH:ubiquinone oxidoreductase subunit E
MKEKIKVTLCVGTACHLMGAADLVTIDEFFDDYLKNNVEVKWVTCMEHCKDDSKGKPPFVLIEDELISEATLDKVLTRARKLAENRQAKG